MCKFFSHPDKELKEHLASVAELMKIKFDKIVCSEVIENLKEHLINIIKITGVSHDFAKYTSYFQKHLRNNNRDELSNHGLLSALFAFFLVDKYLCCKSLKENEYLKFLPLLVFQCIKHHHGNLNNLDREINDLKIKLDILQKQMEDILKNKEKITSELKRLLGDIFCQSEDFDFLEEFSKKLNTETQYEDYPVEIIFEIGKLNYCFNNKINEELKDYYFIINQYIYSLLISSDKIDAASLEQINVNGKEFSLDIVEQYKNNNFNSKNKIKFIINNEIFKCNLIEMREKIYFSVLEKLEKIDIKRNKIFTITAPTGTGKTITSFASALKIREKSNKPDMKIIYSLPFTSIIEQNYEVIEKILSLIEDFKENKSLYLLKHHYFSKPEFKVENEKLPVDEALMYIENWDSQVVVTTFVQLFYTLIGWRNRELKKFHNLANSIIILDEVQNIPVKYWKLINHILKLISQYFNTYIVLLTATKPLIFENDESVELLENHEEYFKNLNRTRLIFEEKPMKLDDFVCYVKKRIPCKNSVLVVLNTINSSKEFIKKIKEDKLFSKFTKFYLSTNITPFERLNRIKKIKDCLKNNEKVIVVSTQLIEAGVDIDVEIIFRDIAPFDSIIQCAGRSNRNGKLSRVGEVYIVKLIDEIGSLFAKKIYDSISIDEGTLKIFEENPNKDEKEYLSLINKYFEIMKEKKSSEESKKLINSLREFYFFDKDFEPKKQLPLSNFELIRELPYEVSLFIELDDDSTKILNKFNEIKKEKDRLKKYNAFQEIKSDFYKYIITVRKDKIVGEEIIQDDLYCISEEILNDYYDNEENVGIGFDPDKFVKK
ncbi:MAG: CRISPR-associated helicase Cas3' [Brevinematales bacterium]